MTRPSVARRVVGVLLGAVLMAAGSVSCTSGGDDEGLIVDDGGASAELAAAVERTRDGSGRIDVETTSTHDQANSPGSASLVVEFDGASSRITSRQTMSRLPRAETEEGEQGSPVEPDEWKFTMLAVDGRTYMSADGMYSSTDADGSSMLPAELEDAEWIDVSDEAGAEQLSNVFTAGLAGDPFALMDSFSHVTESGTEEADGIELRRFEATMTGQEYNDALGTEEPSLDDDFMDDATQETIDQFERSRVVSQYAVEHTTVHATFLVTGDGLLRRSVLETSLDLDDEYADCTMLSSRLGYRSTSDYSDLGDDVEITAPDPATVLTAARAEELFNAEPDEDEIGFSGDPGPTLTTSEGDMSQAELTGRLLRDRAVLGLEPTTIVTMSDEELVQAYEDLLVAAATLEEFDTHAGTMTRPEMLERLRNGDVPEDVDPSVPDDITDEALVELFNRYIDERFHLDSSMEGDPFDGCPG